MRVRPNEFQSKIKQALSDRPGHSFAFEAKLFAQAEELLAAKRELFELHKTGAARRAQKKAQLLFSLQEIVSKLMDLIAIRPDVPAVAAAFAVLVLAFMALHGGRERGMSFTYSDLPDFPKYNDAPARYDAQRLAEQMAYEREVEDAHQKTSGGI
jgi:hypothetical protein